MLRNVKFLFVILAVLVIAGSAYAFAAANTVEASAAGYTATTVSGYDVTAVVYNLNATDPTLVDTINFTVSPSSGASVAKLVKIQTADAGAWTDCVTHARYSACRDCGLHYHWRAARWCDRAECRRQQQPRSCLKMG